MNILKNEITEISIVEHNGKTYTRTKTNIDNIAVVEWKQNTIKENDIVGFDTTELESLYKNEKMWSDSLY